MGRRAAGFLSGIAMIAAAVVCAAPLGFLATTFWPPAWWGVAAVFTAFTAGAGWLWRDDRHHDGEDRIDDTAVPAVPAITCRRPPSPVHGFTHRWWSQTRGRARRVREAAQPGSSDSSQGGDLCPSNATGD